MGLDPLSFVAGVAFAVAVWGLWPLFKKAF